MPEITRPCAVCGATFSSAYTTKPPKVCSPECRKYTGEHRDCEQCGSRFAVRRSSGKSEYVGRFCSVSCSAAHAVATRSIRMTASCEVCGLEFARKASDFKRRDGNRGGRFCSKVCQGVWKSQQPKAPKKPQPKPAPRSRVYFRECVECGRTFCARGANAKRCSTQCKIDAEGARVKDLYAMATQFIDGKYLGAQWRKALIEYLVERDGDKCGICNRKIDITLKSGTRGSRKGPSVDHIIPRSLGGTDDLANLRLACWGCNHSRGNRGGNEQLMLVG